MRPYAFMLLASAVFATGCSQSTVVLSETEAVSEMPVVSLPQYVTTEAVEGDVCRIYGNNFRVEGELLNTSTADTGVVSYTDYEGVVQDLSVQTMLDNTDAAEAIRLYMQGDYSAFADYLPADVNTDFVEYYYYSVDGESYMDCFHDTENDVYYSVVPYGDEYLLASSNRMFFVTLHPETVQFDDPTEDPMDYHVRSTYEEMAVANTIMALQGQSGSTQVSSNPTLYVTEADVQKRKDMVAYNDMQWNPDGTSSDSSVTLDTHSAVAQASQWTLQASSPYSYVSNGLKLYGLYGVKSADSFSIQGTVDNLFASERPWVITIKYLDSDNNLLKVHTVDNTDNPIDPSGTGSFSYTLSGETDLSNIAAIQFELY